MQGAYSREVVHGIQTPSSPGRKAKPPDPQNKLGSVGSLKGFELKVDLGLIPAHELITNKTVSYHSGLKVRHFAPTSLPQDVNPLDGCIGPCFI